MNERKNTRIVDRKTTKGNALSVVICSPVPTQNQSLGYLFVVFITKAARDDIRLETSGHRRHLCLDFIILRSIEGGPLLMSLLSCTSAA